MLLPAIELAAMLVGAQAVEATPVFAPPLGMPLRYRIERVQTTADSAHRFSADRRVQFARDGDGFVADVTLLSIDSDASGPGAMFEAAMAALVGTTIRHRLDANGGLVAVDELDTHFATLVAAIARQGATRGPAIGEALAANLRAMPPEQQRAMIASALRTLLHADVAGRGIVAEHAVAMRPRPPYSDAAPATGTNRVDRSGDALVATTRATMPVAAPGGGERHGDAGMTIDDVVIVDPVTGLLRRSTETTVIAIDGSQASETLVTTTTLLPEVS